MEKTLTLNPITFESECSNYELSTPNHPINTLRLMCVCVCVLQKWDVLGDGSWDYTSDV